MQSVTYDGAIISFRRPFKCKSVVITLVGVNLVSSRSKPRHEKGHLQCIIITFTECSCIIKREVGLGSTQVGR